MGHDTHFLERLERIERPEVELAMSLYRDPKLVAYLLYVAAIPSGADRVALSLDHPVEGPFVIVNQEGRFITCLARGMKIDNLPLITRRRLDELTQKVDRLKQRMGEAQANVGTQKSMLYQLQKDLYNSGQNLTREKFIELQDWLPLLGEEYWRALIFLWSHRHDVLDKLVTREARREAKKGRAPEDLYKRHWDDTWALHHLSLLASQSDETALMVAIPAHMRSQIFELMAWNGTRDGLFRGWLMDQWAVAKLAKYTVGTHREVAPRIGSYQQLLCIAGGLFAIGLRHAGLREEMIRVISAITPVPDTFQVADQRKILEQMCEVLKTPSRELSLNQLIIQEVYKGHPLIPPLEEGPMDAAMANTLLSYQQGDVRFALPELLVNLHLMAPLMSMKAEAFFLPEEWMVYHAEPWQMKDTLTLIDTHFSKNLQRERPPARRAAQPGRNDPCSCGSGQKYKRCCGAGKG